MRQHGADSLLLNGMSLHSKQRTNGKRGLRLSKTATQRALGLWRWELISIILSMLLMIATAASLYPFQDAPLWRWKLPIQPNSLVSVLLTLSKSCVLYALAEGIGQLKWVYVQQRYHRVRDIELFDNASRGPWGSLIFFWRVRWKASVASVGALLCVLTLAMDPFAQMVLSYPTRAATVESNFPFTRTTRIYDPAVSLSETPKLISNLTDAVYQGVMSTGLTVPFNCATGNCTAINLFTSLGLCSECRNVTSETRTTCNRVGSGTRTSCVHTLPVGDPVITNWCSGIGTNPVSLIRLEPQDWPSGFAQPSTFANVSHLTFPQSPPENDESINGSRPAGCGTKPLEVWRCSVSICIQTYSATNVDNGVLSDEPTTTEQAIFPTPGSPVSGCITDEVWQLLHSDIAPAWPLSQLPRLQDVECPPASNKTPEDLERIQSFVHTLSTYPGAYQVNLGALALSKMYFVGWFNGTLTMHDLLQGNSPAAVCGTDQIANFAHHGNFSDFVAAINRSLTNLIRQQRNSTVVAGSSRMLTTYLEVHWRWLVLPAGVILLSAIFLAATIAISAEQEGVVWKGSILALLFHGLSGWDVRHADTDGISDMEHAADDIYASLKRSESGTLALVRREAF